MDRIEVQPDFPSNPYWQDDPLSSEYQVVALQAQQLDQARDMLAGYERNRGARNLLDVWRMATHTSHEELALRVVYIMGAEVLMHPAGLPRLEGN